MTQTGASHRTRNQKLGRSVNCGQSKQNQNVHTKKKRFKMHKGTEASGNHSYSSITKRFLPASLFRYMSDSKGKFTKPSSW